MFKTALRSIMLLLVACGVALASGSVTHRGPDYTLMCQLGPDPRSGIDVNCPELSLSGGFPAPHIFDVAGVSVQGSLSFLEDDFRLWPFIANVAFYYLLLQSVRALLGLLKYGQTS